MKPIEQLQEILCTVESVEKDLSEKVYFSSITGFDGTLTTTQISFSPYGYYKSKQEAIGGLIKTTREKEQYKNIAITIENSIEIDKLPIPKHLMMYCKEKGIDIDYNPSGALGKDNGINKPIAKLDITKDYLYEQEDKVLLEIINFLKG